MRFSFNKLVLMTLIVSTTCAPPALAGGFSHDEAQFASGAGNILYLTAGTLLPLAEDGPQGKEHAIRTLDAFGTSVLFSEGLKRVTHERRPRSGNHDSFPSGHTTAAFAIAAMESRYHPRQSGFWYGGAALIGVSRLQLHKHHAWDVAAGAALGYYVARWELSRRRGLILSPFLTPTGAEGLQWSKRF
jgi:membrane-associated phospholipid phosphatase